MIVVILTTGDGEQSSYFLKMAVRIQPANQMRFEGLVPMCFHVEVLYNFI